MAPTCPHCSATHRSDAVRCPATGLPIGGDATLVGTSIAGRYHLVRLLGDGGMGAVYKAADQVLHRFVAIKLLHPAVASNPRSVERFVREARSAAGIGHPNIIDILDFGHEGNVPYLVMEYLRGRALSDLILKEGPLAIARSCGIATHALAGLTAAHDRGILHRDLKPANLMLVALLGDPDFVKLCDFGFATLLAGDDGSGAPDRALTPARTLVGTPAYAAPERLRGINRPDPRIDVYSVGVVLYEMLTGVRPFTGATFRELAQRIRDEPAPPMRDLRPEIPEPLEQVVQRALAKDPEARWPTAHALAQALVPFGGHAVPVEEEQPSDIFTMDLLKIRSRFTGASRELVPRGDTQVTGTTGPASPADPPVARGGATAAAEPYTARELSVDLEAPVADAGAVTDSQARPVIEPGPPDEEEEQTFIEPAMMEARGVLSLMRFVSRRYGERALKGILDELPGGARAVFHHGIADGAWVPLDAVHALVQQVDARLGDDDLHLVVECGRAAAEGAFDLMRQLKPPSPPPELVLERMPDLCAQLFTGVDFVVERVGKGHGRLRIVEHGPPSLTGCVSTLGFVDRSVDRFGGADVEVNLVSCRALGDPRCLIDVSWLEPEG